MVETKEGEHAKCKDPKKIIIKRWIRETHTLNGLVQHNLGLIQLLLDVRNGVHLPRVLIRLQVLVQRRELDVTVARRARDLGGRLLGQKVVDDLREDLVGRQLGVVLGDDDASDALGAGVAVEGVACRMFFSVFLCVICKGARGETWRVK